MSRWLRIALVVLALSLASLTCSPLYVVRAGIEEAKILSRREPIDRLVESPSIEEEERRKLALVQQARTFAAEMLDLDVGESYTTYSWIERDTLALVLSAARKDRFEAKRWWFPIVGSVPYKGYFSPKSAERAARRLEAQGYDTYIRPTSAFSTLGWFNDPMLSTLLRYDDISLVSTVIHEVTHNTLYLPSQASFNESYASFVGDRGAIAYFCGIEGDDGPRCQEARRRWHDDVVFGTFLGELIADLEEVYERPGLTFEERLALREAVFEDAKRRFVQEVEPTMHARNYRNFSRARLNNAQLIAWRIYYDRLELFERVYQRFPDLPTAVHAIREAAQANPNDPYGALERMAVE